MIGKNGFRMDASECNHAATFICTNSDIKNLGRQKMKNECSKRKTSITQEIQLQDIEHCLFCPPTQAVPVHIHGPL